MRSEALSARNALSLAQARAAADGAVERIAFELLRPRNLAKPGRADGQPHDWQDGEIAIVVTAVDEAAKIDLNAGAEPLLKGLLMIVGGAGRRGGAAARRRDRRLARPGRADAVRTAPRRPTTGRPDRKLRPPNAPFETVGRAAARARHDPGAVRPDRADSLTVYSRQPGINPATASARRAAGAAHATRRAGRRLPAAAARGAGRRSCRSPPFPPARAFAAGAIAGLARSAPRRATARWCNLRPRRGACAPPPTRCGPWSPTAGRTVCCRRDPKPAPAIRRSPNDGTNIR